MSGRSAITVAVCLQHRFAVAARVSACAVALGSMIMGVSGCSVGGAGNHEGLPSVQSRAAPSTTAAGAWCAFYASDNPTTAEFVAQLKEFARRARAAQGISGDASSEDQFVNQYTVAVAPARSATDFLQASPAGSSAAFTKWFCTAADARYYQVSDADAGGADMNKVRTDSAVFSLAGGLRDGCVYTDGAKKQSDPARREMLLNQGDDATRHFRDVAVSYLCPDLAQ